MKSKMLSAVSEPALKQELERLFGEYPFTQMTAQYSRKNNCTGYAHPDGRIELLHNSHKGFLLAVYLHEIAHIALLQQNYATWNKHGGIFLQLCREMQVRFSVDEYADHSYDQQDSTNRISPQDSIFYARGEGKAASYDPAKRAAELTTRSRPADTQQRRPLSQPPPPCRTITGTTAMKRLKLSRATSSPASDTQSAAWLAHKLRKEN